MRKGAAFSPSRKKSGPQIHPGKDGSPIMAQNNSTSQAVAHPAILLARAIGILLGILAVLAHAPAVWAIVAGLAGYSVTLLALRGTWSAVTTQAGKTG